jgi:hypothetical protein
MRGFDYGRNQATTPMRRDLLSSARLAWGGPVDDLGLQMTFGNPVDVHSEDALIDPV